MQDKKHQLLLSILGILSVVLITTGVTYAIFTYTRLGTTDNTVTTGTLKFLYTENSKGGTGISITEAFPITDQEGKNLTGDNKVFDFKVEGTNTGKDEIPYEVTLRKKSTSTLSESNIKVYLTDMEGDADTEILSPTLYSNLTQTNVDVGDEVEKTLHTDTVLGNTANYLKEFRLRMWVDEASNQDDINGKTFTALVNVYSNVPLISEEEIASRNSTELSSLTANGLEATKVTGQDYDYEVNVARGTSSITINTETANSNATIVSVEKIDSLAYSDTAAPTIKRLSTSHTFDLTEGDNYFKITVTSENGDYTKEYILYVTVGLTGLAKKIYDSNVLITTKPTLTNSSNNTSDASGLYMSTATNSGEPTYYFRGNVTNNYVKFAGQTWRIIRINEDGTTRIMLQNLIVNGKYATNYTNKNNMYYINSVVKQNVDDWYKTNISDKGYDDYVVVSDFCGELKVLDDDSNAVDNKGVKYSSYTPNFKCNDSNYNYLLKVGLITYDEFVYAGGYVRKSNDKYYLYNGDKYYWTLSPSGKKSGGEYSVWYQHVSLSMVSASITGNYYARPVINLRTNTIVTGSGTRSDPYVVQ